MIFGVISEHWGINCAGSMVQSLKDKICSSLTTRPLRATSTSRGIRLSPLRNQPHAELPWSVQAEIHVPYLGYREQGLMMLEPLLVLAILCTATWLASPNLTTQLQQLQLDSAVQMIYSGLTLAKNQSAQLKRPVCLHWTTSSALPNRNQLQLSVSVATDWPDRKQNRQVLRYYRWPNTIEIQPVNDLCFVPPLGLLQGGFRHLELRLHSSSFSRKQREFRCIRFAAGGRARILSERCVDQRQKI